MTWLLTLPYAVGYWWGYKRTIDKQIAANLSDAKLAAMLEAWADLLPPREEPQDAPQEAAEDPEDPEGGQ